MKVVRSWLVPFRLLRTEKMVRTVSLQPLTKPRRWLTRIQAQPLTTSLTQMGQLPVQLPFKTEKTVRTVKFQPLLLHQAVMARQLILPSLTRTQMARSQLKPFTFKMVKMGQRQPSLTTTMGQLRSTLTVNRIKPSKLKVIRATKVTRVMPAQTVLPVILISTTVTRMVTTLIRTM